jgi:hypothetical protein
VLFAEKFGDEDDDDELLDVDDELIGSEFASVRIITDLSLPQLITYSCLSTGLKEKRTAVIAAEWSSRKKNKDIINLIDIYIYINDRNY